MIMNPWTIVAALVIAISLFGGGFYKGNHVGINTEKVRTQGIIDGYNIQLAEQKATAASKAIEQRNQAIALQAERAGFQKRLGEEHVKNQELTDRNANLFAAYSLRFRAQPENSGCGYGAGPCEGAKGGSAGNAGASIVQLPAALTANLRRLAKDADDLNDDYRLCYGYAQEIDTATPKK